VTKFIMLARQIGGNLIALELKAEDAPTANVVAADNVRRDFNKADTALVAVDVLEVVGTSSLDVAGIYRQLAHDVPALADQRDFAQQKLTALKAGLSTMRSLLAAMSPPDGSSSAPIEMGSGQPE